MASIRSLLAKRLLTNEDREHFYSLTRQFGNCLLWTGSQTKGSGIICFDRICYQAHHMAWIIYYNTFPDKRTHIIQTCANRLCVAKAHLILMNDEARFLTHVQITEGCWLWTGDRNRAGYGKMVWNGIRTLAHRIAWIRANGPIPVGSHVCHHCDQPSCVRADHLFIGTQADNIHDMIKKKRNPTGDIHWSRRRPEWVLRGSANGAAKMTDEQVREIKRLRREEGLSNKEISERLGIDRHNVKNVTSGTAWKHIK